MTTHTPFQLGSIGTGTHRPEDLLRAFTATLHSLESNQEWSALLNDAVNMADGKTDWDDYMLEELLPNALNELCPPFVYFGTQSCNCHAWDANAHCVDCAHADFGFWVDWDALDSCAELKYGHPLAWTDEYQCMVFRDGDETTVMDKDRNIIWTTV